MSCFSPLVAVRDGFTKNGKPNFKILANIYNYSDIDLGQRLNEQDAILVPCGKCKGCRLDKSRKWADRMLLELDRTKKAVFITLTYDDDHLNEFDVCEYFDETESDYIEYKGNTLCKRDFQLYMKRLRARLYDYELRFYACGEYGKKYSRSHYHEILFGVDLNDIQREFPDLRFYKYNNLKQPMYYSPSFSEKVWRNGFVIFAYATWNDMAYTARYVTKKADGLLAAEKYGDCRIPEFSLMSRNPAIGSYYLLDHPECMESDKIYLNCDGEQKEIYIPIEFYRWLEKHNPKRYNEVKKDFYGVPRIYKEAQKTDLTVPEYYKMRFEKFNKATDALDETLNILY